MRSLLFVLAVAACGDKTPPPASPAPADLDATSNVAPTAPITNAPHIKRGPDGTPLAEGLPGVTISGTKALYLRVESNNAGTPTAAWINEVDLTKGYTREVEHGKVTLAFDGSGRDAAIATLESALASLVTETIVPLVPVDGTGAWSEFADTRVKVEQLGDNPEQAVVKLSVDGASVSEARAPWLSPRMPGYEPSCTDGVEIMDVAYSLEAKVAVLYVDVDGTGCRGSWGIYPLRWK